MGLFGCCAEAGTAEYEPEAQQYQQVLAWEHEPIQQRVLPLPRPPAPLCILQVNRQVSDTGSTHGRSAPPPLTMTVVRPSAMFVDSICHIFEMRSAATTAAMKLLARLIAKS